MKKYKVLVFSSFNNEVHLRDFAGEKLDDEIFKNTRKSLDTDRHSTVIILNKRQFSNLLKEIITHENISKLDRNLWKKLRSMFDRKGKHLPKHNPLNNQITENLISDDFLEEYGPELSHEMEEYLKTFPFPMHIELKRDDLR